VKTVKRRLDVSECNVDDDDDNNNNNVFPRDIVCFRNICINSLHKGDNDDDDDDDDNNNNNYYYYIWEKIST
jgi:hypothetical protein